MDIFFRHMTVWKMQIPKGILLFRFAAMWFFMFIFYFKI